LKTITRKAAWAMQVAGELSPDGIRVHKLAVFEEPRSGKPEELVAKYGIDAAAIIKKVKSLL
jgi:transketolase C-terminal domain/subunit